ncbi:MAG: DNA replication and repair protein RecF [Bacillales bacterium]|jgi:DNA replication and repair protein RecF|nr:DNA replication and repair protein RecF [Bacillales bacterium]
MIISSIKLINFRNYINEEISLLPGINYIYGENGQGKSNLLEGINYLSCLHSFRIRDDDKLIRDGEDNFLIDCQIQNSIKNNLRVEYNENKKRFYLNNKILYQNILHKNPFKTMIFYPNQVTLWSGIASERRGFFDEEISKISPMYSYHLKTYNNLLKQRNNILKDNFNENLFEVLSYQMGLSSDYLIKKRIEYLKKINFYLPTIFQSLLDKNKTIKIEYNSFLSKDKSEEHFLINKEKEIILKHTYEGPHNDDFICLYQNKNIKEYGSQGENRLAVIALKLTAIKVLKEETNEEPVILLDDVLSELDVDKKDKLIDYLKKENQIIITSTNKPENENGIQIKKGKVI